MDKIDFEKILIKFLNSPFNKQFDEKLKSALEEQGLEYKDGEIVKTQRRVAAEAKEAIFDDEDEDERIRKALITFFQRFPYDSIEKAGTNAKEALAWLEKQELSQSVTKISEQVWSEDDEEKFAKVYYATLNFYGGDISLAWLKSLKKRLGGL